MSEKSVWVVSAGGAGEAEEYALEHGRIGYIPDERLGNISGIKSYEELKKRIEEVYQDLSKWTRATILANLWAVRERMKKGDLVVLRRKTSSVSAVAVGEIISDYSYDESVPSLLRHGRKVKWLKKEVLRSKFDKDLLYSFNSLLTISRVNRPDAYERVISVVRGKQVTRSEPEDGPVDFEQLANDEILAMIIREFKGHDFQQLVAEILRAKGYKEVLVSTPGPDWGVDILAGCEPMGFGEPRLCVQVKSSEDKVGVKEYNELKGAMGNFKARHGLLVSWGGFTSAVEKKARDDYFEVRLWGQKDLLRELFSVYEDLSEEIKARLPLKRIWVPVPREEV